MQNPNDNTAPSDDAELGRPARLIGRIWRQRRLAAAVFLGTVALAVLALIVLPTRYLATGSVIVAEQEPGASNTSAAWVQKVGDPADLESQLLIIRSPRVLRLAMNAPGVLDLVQHECRFAAQSGGLSRLMSSASTCEKLATDSNALLDYVQGRYLVGSVGRSRVINISYTSPLPDVAQKMANALITAFLDDQRTVGSTSREVAAAWLWQEVKQLDAELRDEDAKIQAFRRTKGLMRGAQAPISSERLTSIGQQLSSAEAARAEAAARLQEIHADQARGSSNSPAVLASRAVGDLKQQLTVLNAQVASNSDLFGPNHPTLKALKREQDSVQERLNREVASIAASQQKTYDAADALVISLKQQMEAVRSEVASATSDEASIESMVRGAEIKRQQYADLYKKASELETERRVLLGSTRLVSLAEVPSRPSFPRRVPFLAAGLTIGFLLGIGAALWRDRSTPRSRPSSDLSAVMGTPVFAELPRVSRDDSGSMLRLISNGQAEPPLDQVLAWAASDPAFQGALGKLLGSLSLARGHKTSSRILITSPRSEEGKTFTTLALARFAAGTGLKVLVVECDMLFPKIAAALHLKSSAGLAAVLRGHAMPQDAVIKTAQPKLDLLPAGTPVANAGELLAGETMSDLMTWAAQTYDLVLLDGPASGVQAEVAALAGKVDGVLCCIRTGHSSIGEAMATIAKIRSAGGDVFGLAITMVRPERAVADQPAAADGYRRAS